MPSLIRGRGTTEEQIANAPDDFVDLTPVSEEPADNTRAKWRPLMNIGARDGNQVRDEEFDD